MYEIISIAFYTILGFFSIILSDAIRVLSKVHDSIIIILVMSDALIFYIRVFKAI